MHFQTTQKRLMREEHWRKAMKKFSILLFIVLLVGGLAGPVLAQYEEPDASTTTVDEANSVRGRIVSVNALNGTIVISPLSGGAEQTLIVNSALMEPYAVGDRVRIKYDPATLKVESIKKTVYKKGRWYNYEPSAEPE
jgi:hypothetical protein